MKKTSRRNFAKAMTAALAAAPVALFAKICCSNAQQSRLAVRPLRGDATKTLRPLSRSLTAH